MINSAGARFLGRTVEEVIGKDDRDLFVPDDARSIMERDRLVMATGESQTFEEASTAAGVTRTYLATKSVYRDAQGKVIGLIGIARDVTELKRLEEQFLQAQKMEAVGRLAGGVAHDFNNLLTVINGYSQMIFGSISADDPNREMLAKVIKSGERAANLTRQLLAFSSNQILQPQVVNLNILLGELRKLLRPLIGESVELALELDPDLGLAKVDPGQFEHAVINLVVNARDAMPEGGRLTIESYNAGPGEDHAVLRPEVGPGRYVVVTVSDSGQGMDEMTRTRIFEPFFTTKEPGKGTGLGLAMVYGFVKQSGGHVEVHSELGHGTTFEVYLPRVEEVPPSVMSLPDPLKDARGTETILLTEDQDDVRTMSALFLESSGYTVLQARNGPEAVSVSRQYEGPIHLLLTDLMMPGMNGRQLADLLARERPRMRVLFMSGYTDETVLRHEVREAGVDFLQKPFSPTGLARKVRDVLDAEEG
jgi:PAS domain S-box-containing protein